jgi:hypothetical protein
MHYVHQQQQQQQQWQQLSAPKQRCRIAVIDRCLSLAPDR